MVSYLHYAYAVPRRALTARTEDVAYDGATL